MDCWPAGLRRGHVIDATITGLLGPVRDAGELLLRRAFSARSLAISSLTLAELSEWRYLEGASERTGLAAGQRRGHRPVTRIGAGP